MYFIINPIAGRGRSSRIVDSIKSILAQKGIPFHGATTTYPGHATELAMEAIEKGYRDIIAVGGDGTIYEVVNGLMDSNGSLGVIPAGTGNDFAHGLHLPMDPSAALDVILKGQKKLIDIGTANEKVFINVAGTGFDADVLMTMKKARKILKGKLIYLISALSTLLRYQFRDVSIEVDGKVYHRRILLVAIANGSYYGGGMQVAPKANMEDGKLDVCIISSLPKWRVPFLLPKFIKGDHLHFSFVEYYRGEHVRISSSMPSPLNIDGELAGTTPLECSLKPLSLSVFVS